ncbi:MAG: enoyl-CoA hydratase/isomerase family protein [Proteobacteria bacterium]|nr:enoyl-CoA hydratase/isomerase family protein [Pseudomonadota bacterium]MBU1738161.1 enoyl-CoA hydratase/isomerase family protein [Pseudomonadota bacterium]
MKAFKFDRRDDGIGEVTFDLPDSKVNILSPSVVVELEELISGLAGDPGLKGVIFASGKKDNFIAGADISVIEKIGSEEEGVALASQGQKVFNDLAALPFPTVAVIDGSCLGGGTEFALACTYRVLSDNPKSFLGLPETQLGIIPGFGGTQRLPRLVGIVEAVRMITSGARIYGGKALRMGLVDEVAAVENLPAAAVKLISGHPERKQCRFCMGTFVAQLDRFPLWRWLVFRQARQEVTKKTGEHYPALFKAIDAIEQGLSAGMAKGLEVEATLLGRLAVTGTARNLQKVFRLHEKFSRVDTSSVKNFAKIGVVGAGVMGGGIVGLIAEHAMQPRLINRSTKGISVALEAISRVLAGKLRKRIYTRDQVERLKGAVTWDTTMRGMHTLNAVIEAVVEEMAVKKKILADIAGVVGNSTLILSNTSSLSITEMAKDVQNPARVAGFHFFNPVDRMKLVEVIHGEQTSEETVAKGMALAKRLGKIPVRVKDSPGFLVNRLLLPYLNEAARMLEEGGRIDRIDRAMTAFGMPLGPFRLLDMVGLDIAAHVAEILNRAFGERMRPSPLLASMQVAGRLGNKNGRGFYDYGSKRNGDLADDIYSLLQLDQVPGKTFSDEEIVDRLIMPMINEAVLCLEESVVSDAGTVDAAMIFGAGFPPYTGGLIRYADTVGAGEVVRRLGELVGKGGERFAPAPLLRKMAELGAGFYDD